MSIVSFGIPSIENEDFHSQVLFVSSEILQFEVVVQQTLPFLYKKKNTIKNTTLNYFK